MAGKYNIELFWSSFHQSMICYNHIILLLDTIKMLVSDVTKKVWRIWSVVSTLLCPHTTINIRHCSTAALQRGAQDRVLAVCSSCIMCLQSTCCVTLQAAAHCSTAWTRGRRVTSGCPSLRCSRSRLQCAAVRRSGSVLHKNCMTFTHLQNQDLARTLVLKHLRDDTIKCL